MQIDVTFSPKERVVRACSLELALGATLGDCVAQLLADPLWKEAAQSALDGDLHPSIWNRRAKLDDVLRDGDHVNLSRGLLVDPMVARRERFAKQGARSAGLFSKRRPGAKPGY